MKFLIFSSIFSNFVVLNTSIKIFFDLSIVKSEGLRRAVIRKLIATDGNPKSGICQSSIDFKIDMCRKITNDMKHGPILKELNVVVNRQVASPPLTCKRRRVYFRENLFPSFERSVPHAHIYDCPAVKKSDTLGLAMSKGDKKDSALVFIRDSLHRLRPIVIMKSLVLVIFFPLIGTIDGAITMATNACMDTEGSASITCPIRHNWAVPHDFLPYLLTVDGGLAPLPEPEFCLRVCSFLRRTYMSRYTYDYFVRTHLVQDPPQGFFGMECSAYPRHVYVKKVENIYYVFSTLTANDELITNPPRFDIGFI